VSWGSLGVVATEPGQLCMVCWLSVPLLRLFYWKMFITIMFHSVLQDGKSVNISTACF